jgi:hypothetical protein
VNRLVEPPANRATFKISPGSFAHFAVLKLTRYAVVLSKLLLVEEEREEEVGVGVGLSVIHPEVIAIGKNPPDLPKLGLPIHRD